MTDNWLTPETAIGARLPCGATVERAEWLDRDKEFVTVFFDRAPAINMDGNSRPEMREFYLDGRHRFNKLPNLIPPTPAQPGVFVTREAAKKVWHDLIGTPHTFEDFTDALGIPPDPQKQTPWEAALLEWVQHNAGALPYDTFEAGVMFAVEQIEAVAAPTCNSAKMEVLLELRRRITGDTK